MHVVARARLVFARRPWLYWAIVAALGTALAVGVNDQLTALEEARRNWGSTRSVLVADRQLEPGDPIETHAVDLPVAAIPPGALDDLPDGAQLHQRVSIGEVLTDLDLTTAAGPAARAAPGTVVVALSDPLSRGITTGLKVQVAADGLVIADSATVVEMADDVIFVAVEASAAPMVAAAAQQGIASLLYLP
ncbi:MAG TPA: hypothetical protein VES40_19555 [Ilumatobacteraceae bacterium]|nr:hypothetical protein [Ilumatobacteraceae bacterium]